MSDDDGDIRERVLDDLRFLLGFCTRCAISDALDQPHEWCAGPEGYVCECYCDGGDVE